MKVNSFDVFDTLIARRCIEPTAIFDIVAERTGIAEFKSIRVSSEKAIINTNYTYDDIYNEFQRVTGLDDDSINLFKKLEKEIELENCIPVTENLRKVKNGDLLISDMYHSADFISSMLKKCGLNKEVSLIVTSGGKHTGRIWGQLSPFFDIKTHHGDNLHSDIKSPISNSIHANHTDIHKFNQIENEIHNSGFHEISKIVRELRLKTLDINQDFSRFQKLDVQLSCNIPILILTSIYLKFLSTKLDSSNILFSSRDCFYLHKIYNRLFSSIDVENYSSYLYTSRHARINCSDSYKKYALSKINSKTLIVDLCGTGLSLSKLYSKCGITPHTFFIHKLADDQIHGYKSSSLKMGKNEFLSIVESVPFDNGLLEILNYVDHGMAADVLYIDELDAFYPVFEDPEYPTYVNDYIIMISDTMAELSRTIDNYPLKKLISESFHNIEKIPNLIYSIYAHLNNQKSHFRDIEIYHKRQDGQTMMGLSKL
jgi:hypothetical protein